MPTHHTPPERFVTLRGRRFGYLDFGGDGPAVLALHGHFGRGRIFAGLADALRGRYRVIALDQRAHGTSDNGGDVRPEEYVADAAEFVQALGLAPVAVVGHSMGGAVGYLLAARHPELVHALAVVDMGAVTGEPEVAHPVLDVTGWPRRAPSRAALAAGIEAAGIPDPGYFMDSAVEFADGWGLLFDHGDMMRSQRALLGDYWAEWASGRQPALLLRGAASTILSASMARRMAGRRPGCELVEFPGCGHWLYADDPDAFARAVGGFLDRHRPAG
ncbi:alpha/beta fold hydrolase [Marinactinospora rubrisoli]|uniref:Alpha/beta fold hydrolase n=1 Tax=Marinactinospora rubrisoli TaxID=2715399 RepID=A0ABW2KNV1_9ACTN